MGTTVAATITIDDLQNYFKGGGSGKSPWRATIRDDGVFEARGNIFHVEIGPPGSPMFAVQIQAHEDSSDRDEAVTDDPMKFLVDFLKTGSAGDEALQKMAGFFSQMSSLPPEGMANVLRSWADDVEHQRVGPRVLSRALRHASLMPSISEYVPLLAALIEAASREEVEIKEMRTLADEMTKKGWRGKAGKNDRGLPELTVDIAGVYESKIEIDHIPWKYSFEVHDHPNTKEDGITNDPIIEFQEYADSEPVQTARSDLKAGKEERAEKAKEEGTVAPSKKRPMLRDSGIS